ncbi:MAG: nicotinate-nucleotide--dimethylbenzimidazole phosphoribosyltransferase [Oscillospiraceae bacterium]|nr:nicotinate-nucleotide--dimethylbenzimidazole phosphoribosyltransferase [Oscillospiraceae bacterium]MBP1560685.1 nicotinate-nucleotide--dimethylbenzimidazole phosphoribosyltransferase [Oscillospiraceae bacterium]
MNRIYMINPSDKGAEKAAHSRWNSIAKPLGSLGLLETAVERIAAVQGTENVDIHKRTVVVMCADNGVVCEGVTQSDSSVTAVCANAIANGTSNINALAETFGTDVLAVDIGINGDVDNPKLLNRKIAYGTKNIAVSSAMTAEQAEQAICTGMNIVCDLKAAGVKIIVTGEMGIGNTTTASAVSSVLLNLPPRQVTGRGAGLDSARLEHKISVIERAISVNNPNKNNPVGLLSKLGGFDIAGMVGLFLGGAYYHIPVVIDGVISAVAAVLACKINPLTVEYMLSSHISAEPAGKMLLEIIGLKPIITAEMRLGEGTGGVMLLPLLDGALSVYNSAHRFDDISIERYKELK